MPIKIKDKYYDVEVKCWATTKELQILYEQMKEDNDLEEHTFEEWLEVALDPLSGFLSVTEK